MHLPIPGGRYRLYTDWSAQYMSAILHQVFPEGERPVYYASRACKGAETRLCSAEGELLAAAFGLAKFR